jgi:hypothetical protein
MLTRTIVPAVGAGFFFMAVSAFAQIVIPAGASSPPMPQFPPIGLASSETVQVNVVNISTLPSGASSSSTTPPSCTGTITFYNSSGSIIGAATPFTVGSGQIFSATLPYASSGGTGARTVVRVGIQLSVTTTASLQPPAFCALSSSLETYDTATGVTHSFVAGGAVPGLTAVLRPTPFFAPAP